MTREEILAMPVGRKLDWLIHEKVMGNDLTGFEWPRQGEDIVRTTETGVQWITLPQYSTDISAAWEVVEKMRSENVYLSIQTHHNGYATEISTVDGEDTYSIFDTVPKGICRVALLAVMEGQFHDL